MQVAISCPAWPRRAIASRSSIFLLALGALCPLLGGGCGGGSSSLVEVSGRVTDGATPVAGASVSYQPIAKSKEDNAPGPSSFGITDAEGRYQLRTFKDDLPGAVKGQHRVYISLDSPAEEQQSAPVTRSKKIPKQFGDGSTVVEVPSADETDFNFDISG